MTAPKFPTNSLVTLKEGIYQVIGLSSQGPKYHYKLMIVAFQRYMKGAEYETGVDTKNILIEESLLSEFRGKKPKYKFGEGVRLRAEINCIVEFIEYKKHSYYYTIREKETWSGDLLTGWIVEEGYLQKW